MARRIQRKRTKGWRMPLNTVYVGRPTKWGNPYRAGDWYIDLFVGQHNVINPEYAVKLYRAIFRQDIPLPYISAETDARVEKIRKQDVSELKSRNLACWCPLDQPCHADVLLEIANAKGE